MNQTQLKLLSLVVKVKLSKLHNLRLQQVVKDLITERGEAKRSGDPGALQKATKTLQSYAQRFLKRKAPTADAAPRPKKMQRTKAWQWCCALDNALQVGAGVALSSFQITVREVKAPTKPLTWPVS